jgi:RNA polymerase sigma-70 factor (ECF subfamily)
VALVGDDPADQVQRKDLQRRIHHAIASLPVDHRVVVILRDLEGLAYDEIAKMLTIPVGTVRSRLSRGRDALRTMLADVAPAGGTVQWKANG